MIKYKTDHSYGVRTEVLCKKVRSSNYVIEQEFKVFFEGKMLLLFFLVRLSSWARVRRWAQTDWETLLRQRCVAQVQQGGIALWRRD